MIEVVKQAQVKGKKVVMTNDCFDILHAGYITDYVSYLNDSAALGEHLIVAINSDTLQRLISEVLPDALVKVQRLYG